MLDGFVRCARSEGATSEHSVRLRRHDQVTGDVLGEGRQGDRTSTGPVGEEEVGRGLHSLPESEDLIVRLGSSRHIHEITVSKRR